jgi:outer membrane protein
MKMRFLALLLTPLLLLAALSRVAHAEVLTLVQGLKLATTNSRLIKIAGREEDMAREDALISRAKLLPEVNASASLTSFARQPGAVFGSLSVPTSERGYPAYTMSVEQTLYDFQKNASRYKASMLGVDIRKIDTRRIRNIVGLSFAVAYFDLLESNRMVDVAEREVERVESHLKDTKNLYEQGVVTKNDVLQAEVRLADSRQRLLAAKNLSALNASQINNFLLRPLNSPVQPEEVDPLLLESRAVFDLGKAWDVAMEARPELQIVDTTLKAQDFEEKAQKADYLPKFFVKGEYDYMDNRYLLHEANAFVLFGMSINLYKGGSTKAEVAKIEYGKERLREQRNQLVDEIKLEVKKYILDSETAKQRVAATKDAVNQAEENLRIDRVKYTEGVGTATDVLDAVTLLTVAETNYYRSLYDLMRAEAGILYATGRDIAEVYQ